MSSTSVDKPLVVDEIFASSIHSPIGPANLFRRFYSHQDSFLSHGVDQSLFMIDFSSVDKEAATVFSGQYDERQTRSSLGIFAFIPRSWNVPLKRIAKRSVLFTSLYLWYVNKWSRITVKRYLSYGRTPDILVFTSFEDLRVYLQIVAPPYPKLVLFHHNDGSAWDMEEINFPKLRRTPNFKKLDADFLRAIMLVDANVFIASSGREHFHELYPQVSREKLFFFHNGVDDVPYSPRVQDPALPPFRLVSAGTVTPRKGQHLVIEAMGRLSAERRALFTFTVIGDGPGRYECESLVEKYALQNQVKFLGRIPNDQIQSHLEEASIYILMSNNEGLPLSIIEGMRAGLPVISTRVAGIPEMVETGRNGVLLSPSADELFELFSKMESYDWQRMGRVSRERFDEGFTIEKMIESYCDVLHRL